MRQATIARNEQSLILQNDTDGSLFKLELDDHKRIKSFLRLDKLTIDGREQQFTRYFKIIKPADDSDVEVSEIFFERNA